MADQHIIDNIIDMGILKESYFRLRHFEIYEI